MLKGKAHAYAVARSQGLPPGKAALHAGYTPSAARVRASELEKRPDVRAEIKRLKETGVEVPAEGGRPAPDSWEMKDHYESSLALLRDIYNNPLAPKSMRYQAAKDALPYEHARKEGGKKEEAAKAAKKVAKEGKFGVGQKPTHLRAVG